MRPGIALVLAAPLLLGGCVGHGRSTAASGTPRYTLGAPYLAGGTWRYPREAFRFAATGLAAVQDRGPGLTADGERYDPDAMAGAHPTLQLPCIARVTNLDTGRQVLVRLNDRGPNDPGRLVALTPRAAALIGLAPGGTARVSVALETGPSLALRDALEPAPEGIVAAPIGPVTVEDLPVLGASARRGAVRVLGEPGEREAAPALPPDRLPASIVQVVSRPGRLRLDLGEFQDRSYAARRAAQLARIGARVERDGHGRTAVYRVLAGPFSVAAQADAALDQARRAGVFDATITAE